MTVPLLPADQAELVEAVARRVVELLDEREPATAGLVSAGTLARLFGISRSTVYEHAAEFGAVQLPGGARSLVRFDVERARAAWTACTDSERSETPGPPAPTDITRRRRRTAAQTDADLLPIRGQA